MTPIAWLASIPLLDLLALILAMIYLFSSRNFLYWQDKGVFHIRPSPLLGNLLPLISLEQSPGVFIEGVHKQANSQPYVGFYIFDRPALLIRDPGVIQRIFVKDFHCFTDRITSSIRQQDPVGEANLFCLKGVNWRHIRNSVSGTFTTGRIKMNFKNILKCAVQTREYIQKQQGQPINVKDLFVRSSVDTVCSCLLGIQSNTLQNSMAQFHYYATKMVHWTPYRALEYLSHFLAPDLIEIVGGMLFQEECTAFLVGAIKESICARELSNNSSSDYVDVMARLKKKNQEKSSDDFVSSVTEMELLGQAVLFFAAGFETSSSTMCFACYELALNLEVQTALRTEIKEVLERYKGEVTYEAVQEMQYLDMVVAETLRKYPPLPFVDRTCTEDFCLPGTDIVIEKGTPVVVSLLGIQRDPQYYINPLLFDPQRFSKKRKSEIIPYTYMPFGEGPRKCPGMRFGLLLVKLVLVQVLEKFQVALHINTPVPLILSPYVFVLKNRGRLPLMFIAD